MSKSERKLQELLGRATTSGDWTELEQYGSYISNLDSFAPFDTGAKRNASRLAVRRKFKSGKMIGRPMVIEGASKVCYRCGLDWQHLSLSGVVGC